MVFVSWDGTIGRGMYKKGRGTDNGTGAEKLRSDLLREEWSLCVCGHLVKQSLLSFRAASRPGRLLPALDHFRMIE